MIKISVVGTGYVGLVTGACLSEFGLNVIGLDVDEKKIEDLEKGIIPIYEPGLDKIVQENSANSRLQFTTDYEYAVKNSDVIFIAVGTPPCEDGSADLQYVLSAARSIAKYMDGYKVIVDKSTVPVGTGRLVRKTVQEVLDARGVDYEFDVVSNPEFLREGSAVQDFTKPDRIVIGCESERAKDILKKVYRVLYINNHPFVFCNIETAELIKYASNAFLATKITFANEIANLCEAVGADVKQVSKAMGQDPRIGKSFLNAGAGYGGSCFPKDTNALASIGRKNGVVMSVVEATIEANEQQKHRMVQKIENAMGDLSGKNIALLGLAFKPETDDMREAPALTVVNELIKAGATIRAYDPAAMENSKKYYLPDLPIIYCENEYEAAADADAIVIITEWNCFRSLDIDKLKALMKDNYFFDLRNIYDRQELEQKFGYRYYAVGR